MKTFTRRERRIKSGMIGRSWLSGNGTIETPRVMMDCAQCHQPKEKLNADFICPECEQAKKGEA